MIDQLKSMAIFAKVVEEMSFRGAANKLRISPSIVSLHIKQLEERIGSPLIYRSTRAMSLTSEGRAFYQFARKMVSAARDGLDLFGEHAHAQLTELRVAIPQTLVSNPVFSKITAFAKNHTGIRLHVISSDIQQDMLREGHDVAIRMGRLADSELKMKKIGEDRRVVIASPSYLAGKPVPTSPDDLNDWDFISFSAVPDGVELRKPKQRAKLTWGKTSAMADSVQTVRELAIAGLGVATLPFHEVKRELEEKCLEQVLPEWSDRTLGIYIVWPRNADLSLATREFINYLSS